MASYKKCPECKRLLYPTATGGLPPHKAPAAKSLYGAAMQPLTGADAPWCVGGELYVEDGTWL